MNNPEVVELSSPEEEASVQLSVVSPEGISGKKQVWFESLKEEVLEIVKAVALLLKKPGIYLSF